MLNLSDRFLRGFLSGIAGGIVLNIIDVIANILKIDEKTYFDWAGIIIFGSSPHSLLEHILAVIIQLFFCGGLGIIFALIIPEITSKNFLFKGWIWGMGCWFSIYGLIFLFRLKNVFALEAKAAGADALSASAFGIVLALTMRWLDTKKNIT